MKPKYYDYDCFGEAVDFAISLSRSIGPRLTPEFIDNFCRYGWDGDDEWIPGVGEALEAEAIAIIEKAGYVIRYPASEPAR